MSSPPSPHEVLGPYYIGVVLGTFLYGILVLQCITYYQGFKRDRRWLRYFILYIFIAETANTTVSIAMIYEPLIAQFGTIKPMFLFPSLLPGQPIMETAVSVPVQFFYAWRLRIILQNWIVPVLICLTSLSALGGAWWTAFEVINAVDYLHKSQVDHSALVWSCSSAACDVLITASLFFSLRNRKTGVKHTDDTVDRIIRTTVQTGAITMIFTGLNVGLFVGLSNSTLNFVFDFALPKLYSNALVSTLNARGGTFSSEQRNVLFSNGPGTGTQPHTAGGGPTSVVNINKSYNSTPDFNFIEMHRHVEVHRDDMLNLDSHPYRDPK